MASSLLQPITLILDPAKCLCIFVRKPRQSTTLLTWLFLSWNPKECIPLMNSPRLYGSLRNASRYIEESNSKTKDFIFLMLKWLYLVIFKTAKTMASSHIQNSDDYRGSKFETSLILSNKQYSSGGQGKSYICLWERRLYSRAACNRVKTVYGSCIYYGHTENERQWIKSEQ